MIKTVTPKISFAKKTLFIAIYTLITMFIIGPGSLMAQEDDINVPVEVNFDIEALENNRFKLIIYVDNNATWVMQDLVVKISLPAGAGFIEAGSPANTTETFDGQEITFNTNTLGPGGSLENYIVLETLFPGQTIFTTQPWASWQGQEVGSHYFEEVMFDLAAPFLEWEGPSQRMRLHTRATIVDRQLTYYTYVENIEGERTWDVGVNIPLPANSHTVETIAAPAYEGGFNGQAANFFSLEPSVKQTFTHPLIVKATLEAEGPYVSIQPNFSWINFFEEGATYGYPAKEAESGDLMLLEPDLAQWVVSDPIGDVPELPYDLTNAVFQRDGEAIKITFYTAENLPLLGEGSRYRLYIDLDCSLETGENSTSSWNNTFGLDYRLTYERDQGRARLHQFNKTLNDWESMTDIGHWADRKTVTMWLPYQDLPATESFCWVARADSPRLDFRDILPDTQNQALTYYDFNWDSRSNSTENVTAPIIATEPEPEDVTTSTDNAETVPADQPTTSEAEMPPPGSLPTTGDEVTPLCLLNGFSFNQVCRNVLMVVK